VLIVICLIRVSSFGEGIVKGEGSVSVKVMCLVGRGLGDDEEEGKEMRFFNICIFIYK
jgi:hypothetical protein